MKQPIGVDRRQQSNEPGPPTSCLLSSCGRQRQCTTRGAVVAYDGGTFQAWRDTGQPPSHADWMCLATSGRDGNSVTVRGTFDQSASYRRLDSSPSTDPLVAPAAMPRRREPERKWPWCDPPAIGRVGATYDERPTHHRRLTASTAFNPPKAKELDSAASIRRGRASLGT
jgi:hypothetical protein